MDLFVSRLSWWIDPARARAHEKDFEDRFGYAARRQWEYVSTSKPENFAALNGQLRELLRRSRRWDARPVSIIPPLIGPQSLDAYYTSHNRRFGYDRCLSIFHEVQVTSNDDVSPCRS